MSDQLSLGVAIAIVGMGGTLAALALFAVVVAALQRLLPPERENEAARPSFEDAAGEREPKGG